MELSHISLSSALRFFSSIFSQPDSSRLLEPDMEVSGVLRSWDMARRRLLRSFSLSLSVRALSLSR